MKISIPLVSIAILFLVSACAPKMWIRENTSQDQFNKDRDHCELAGSSAGSGNPLIINSVYNSCMKERGYKLGSRS